MAGGRPPKPTQLKALQGNPGRRPLPVGEPTPEPGRPTRPEWLWPEAKREWTRLTGELERLGMLAVIDRGALAAACQSWAIYVDAIRDIATYGTTFVTEKGYQGPRPAVGIANKALQQYMAICGRFGVTPSDRARLGVKETKEEVDPFEAFLRGSGQVKASG
jgi:P27 family predicted phage terminase small subunit